MLRSWPLAGAIGAVCIVSAGLGLWLLDTRSPDRTTAGATGPEPVRMSFHYKTSANRVQRHSKADLTRTDVYAKRPRPHDDPLALAARPRATPLDNLAQRYGAQTDIQPAKRTVTRLVSFRTSPFPYAGTNPRTGKPFLNISHDGRRGHQTRSGRKYWADQTYNDRRALLHIPKGFDVRRKGMIVLFFHGHGATLKRDVMARQQVPDQIRRSGMNAVLVAPQFAVNARDSSPGKFWTPNGVRRFLDESARRLAALHGDARTEAYFAKMPIMIVGYSGGYLPAAWALARGGVSKRIKGVVLLDGLYGHTKKFADWIENTKSGIFVSGYARSTRQKHAGFKKLLDSRSISYRTNLPFKLRPGTVALISTNRRHRDFVTLAWGYNPISDVLGRFPGIDPRASNARAAALDATPVR